MLILGIYYLVPIYVDRVYWFFIILLFRYNFTFLSFSVQFSLNFKDNDSRAFVSLVYKLMHIYLKMF